MPEKRRIMDKEIQLGEVLQVGKFQIAVTDIENGLVRLAILTTDSDSKQDPESQTKPR